ncbi:MAG TPA: hypothetical protein VKB86_02710 [Pyrinomonadaceae bacterium]|nr:hypothetical protein [Pyrinomonadaceae bacterium]
MRLSIKLTHYRAKKLIENSTVECGGKPQRDTNSPYDDHTPLMTPCTPEMREYQAYGLVGDDQIGQASDIVSATFTG